MTTLTYLSLLLYAEGASDYRLLTPLLRRLTEQLCRLEARGIVDVGDVIGIEEPRRFRDKDRATVRGCRPRAGDRGMDARRRRGASGRVRDDVG